ncbi:hypothetical protein H312_00851 [Anncaliia algerae PRA339]|uniref:Spt6 SH2 domain-containing protein n=1 Tax=Anncaliia algerae PRA339 TaxID=1288291 RepID=A0A059F326_9MICR|nr:hypothetical protein H312_00851 [Anncaliia algerae PRA339]
MLFSSDEDIINRKTKVQKKRNLENLFDSEEQSEELSIIEEDNYRHEMTYSQPISSKLFTEIFGTGKEYFFMVENIKPIVNNEPAKEPVQTIRKISEDLLSFLIDNLEEVTYSVLKSATELILEGACVEYLIIGKPEFNLNLKMAYKIYDLIEYYFNNEPIIEKLKRIQKLNIKFAQLIGKSENTQTFSQFVINETNLYKILTKENLLINKNKFKENILENERIYSPNDDESADPQGYIAIAMKATESYEKNVVLNYLSNEYLKDILLKDAIIELIMKNAYLEVNNTTFSIEELQKNAFYEIICEFKNNNYKILFDLHKKLINLFINNTLTSKWNEFRKELIMKILESFNYEQILRGRLQQKFKEIATNAISVHIMDLIINGRVKYNEFYMGVTVEKFNLKCSIVDYAGNLAEFRMVNINDRETLNNLMDVYKITELYISGVSPKSLRQLKSLDKEYKYVDNTLIKRYSNSKDFTHNIIRMIILPEVELAYMINNGMDIINFVLESMIPNDEHILPHSKEDFYRSGSFNEPIKEDTNLLFFAKLLTQKEREEATKRAIQSAISIVGVDINMLISHKRNTNIIKFIPGFHLTEEIKEYKVIDKLSRIESATKDSKDFDFRNAAVFLRSNSSNADILDKFPIHPYNYKYARMLCAALIGKKEIDDINLSSEVKIYLETGANQIHDIQKVSHIKDLYDNFIYTLGVLNQEISYFDGLPDHLIFRNLVGEFKCGVYEGVIVEAQKGFMIISVADRFNVYVRNSFEQTYYINQAVKVRITQKNINFLTYSGEIIPEIKKAESKLEVNEENFCIRKSRKNDSYYIFINLEEGILYPLKIELIDDKIFLQEKYYDDVEELKFKFIRPLFVMLKKSKKHPKFFNSHEEAESFVKNSKEKIDYAFYLSKEYPGRIVFLLLKNSVHKEYIKLTDKLLYNNKVFNDLEEFINYRKNI